MTKKRIAFFVFTIVAVSLLGVRHFVLPNLIIQQMAVLPDRDETTPADVGIPYEDASFIVGNDRLAAWYVEPASPRNVAFLLLHGDGESIADFVEVQRLLFERGYASLVYDYAGFGDSEGKPSMRWFDREPRAALAALLERVPEGTRVSVLGHSFGAGVAVGSEPRKLDTEG